MGYQDRSYYRDSAGRGSGSPLAWLVFGSVPLFTVFGIRVRAHAMLIIAMVFVLLFGWGFPGMTGGERVIAALMLFTIVLLHEFGHCFGARRTGGDAEEIIMHPLGGVAYTTPNRRPWPVFVTVACGPLVNVAICIVLGLVLWFAFRMVPWNPFSASFLRAVVASPDLWESYATWGRWVYWGYVVSWSLFLFNMLPIFPLDGGQLLQSILWPKFGYYKSMMFACTTGMVAAVIGGMAAIAFMALGLAIMAGLGFYNCYMVRQQLRQAGPWGFQEEDSPNYAASVFGGEPTATKKHRALNKRSIRRAQVREHQEEALQAKVDVILDKVAQHGMHSLTWWEKRTLRKATEQQKKKELDLREMSKKF